MIATLVLLVAAIAFFEALSRSSTPREVRRPLRELSAGEHLVAAWEGLVLLTAGHQRGRSALGLDHSGTRDGIRFQDPSPASETSWRRQLREEQTSWDLRTWVRQRWFSLREFNAAQVELQERRLLADRPWEEELVHWSYNGRHWELRGHVLPPDDGRRRSTTSTGWCP